MKRIFALFCLIICLILTTAKAQAENIKFVQITDAHISTGSEYSQKVLKSAIADIKKKAAKLKLTAQQIFFLLESLFFL